MGFVRKNFKFRFFIIEKPGLLQGEAETTHRSWRALPAQLAMAGAELARAQLVETCHGLLHRSSELRATNELYTGELHTPMSIYSSKQ